MKCPHCKKKIDLGKLMNAGGRGTPKSFSKAERKRRSDRMKALNTKRRSKPENAEVSDRRAHAPENTTGANGGSRH